MAEVLTEVLETGTKLAFESDRQWDGAPGDATLRIRGESREGTPVADMTMVQVSPEEAKGLGFFLRAVHQPSPEIQDHIAQELQATFSSCLSGRNAHQAAELAWKGITEAVKGKMGETYAPERINALCERFERAASRSTGGRPAGVR